MTKKIKLFTIFGIKISLDYSWFAIFILISWTLAEGFFPYQQPGLKKIIYWEMGIIAAILLFASVLIHELSHSIVANNLGERVREITLFIFGGVAQIEKEPAEPLTELKIAAAGPISSLAIFAVLFGIVKLGAPFLPPGVKAILNYVAFLNLILVIFNMVPAFPLDGGRLLRSLIWYWTKNIRKATSISSRMGKGFAYILMFLGLAAILNGQIIGGIWYIFIGMFLYQAADYGYKQLIYDFALRGIKVKDLMSAEIIPLEEDTNIDALIEDYFLKYKYRLFPVIKGEKITGIVSIDNIKDIPKEKRTGKKVKEVMEPLSESLTIEPEAESLQAIKKMLAGGIEKLLVVREDKLVGILSRREVMDLLRIKIELRGD